MTTNGPLGRLGVAALAIAASLVLGKVAAGGVLYGIGNYGELYSINVQSGAASFLGDTVGGNTTLLGLDAAPVTGVLYAVDNNGGLMTIDPSAAVATWVGRGVGISSIRSLAYNADDGYLYAAQSAVTPSHLFRIDPATGASTQIGVIDFTGSGFGYTSGLAYDSSAHVLYATSSTGASKLYRMDPGSGATTLIGNTGFGYINGLTFAPDTGILYGAASSSGIATLISIDPATGTGTAVGPLGVGIFGLGYVVPEPSTLFLVTFGVAGLLFAARRRWQRNVR